MENDYAKCCQAKNFSPRSKISLGQNGGKISRFQELSTEEIHEMLENTIASPFGSEFWKPWEEMSKEELNVCLKSFYTSARKKDCNFYEIYKSRNWPLSPLATTKKKSVKQCGVIKGVFPVAECDEICGECFSNTPLWSWVYRSCDLKATSCFCYVRHYGLSHPPNHLEFSVL